jgi:hypothetical protein
VIDGATNEVDTTIAVGARPMAFAWNPVQNQVYIANSGSSSISVLRDSALGIEQSFQPHAASPKPTPTVVRGVLVLDAVGSRQNTADGAELLDVGGRKVMSLWAGANDLRRLSPGIYFVRSAPSAVSRQPSAVTKVVVVR